jgi:hypothetical protein
LSHLKRARKLLATQNIQRELHAQVVEAHSREPVVPVVTARSNVMARNLAKLVDGTGSLSCAPIPSVMILTVHQGKTAELHAKIKIPDSTLDFLIGSDSNSHTHSEKPTMAPTDYRSTLARLFPDTAPESIAHLSREELLALMTLDGSQYAPPQDSPANVPSVGTKASTLSMERPDLESLHSIPGEQLEENQSSGTSESIGHISDDVNALSLTNRHPTSYLGVSSIQAALKVIAWLHPEFEAYFSLALTKEQTGQQNSVSPQSLVPPVSCSPPTEMEMVDAYFTNFHPFAPLLDEDNFRRTYADGQRRDNRWQSLVNIVLALGNIAASGSGADNQIHYAYFQRALNQLNLSSLGTPSLEVTQSLGLMGGWYCHYISQPNLGYSLMGAALRMAITLGLQREPYDSHLSVNPSRSIAQESKRRVWWSLCCLEIWGLETLGRPSMDCFGPGITVNLPSLLDKVRYLNIGRRDKERYLTSQINIGRKTIPTFWL